MTRRIILTLILIALLTCCREHKDPRLDLWEEQMVLTPDSVRRLLDSLDVNTLRSPHDKARYALLRTMVRDKCYLPLTPDSTLETAAAYFHHKKDFLNEAKAHYYSGLSYRHSQDYNAALREALYAIDKAHEARDTFWMGRAHDLAYEIYIANYDCRNAALEADKAAFFFKHSGAQRFHRYALLEKAQALSMPSDNDGIPATEGLSLLDSLKNIALAENDTTLAATILYNKAVYYNRLKDYAKMNVIIDSVSAMNNDGYITHHLLPLRISEYIRKGISPQKYMEEFERGLKTSQDTIVYLSKSKDWAVKNSDWEKSFRYSDSILSYYERILADRTLHSLDKSREEHDRQLLSEQSQENLTLRKRNIRIICLLSLLIIIIAAISFYSRRRSKRKEEQLMAILASMAEEKRKVELIRSEFDSLVKENSQLKDKLSADKGYIFGIANPLGNRLDTLGDLAMHYYGCEPRDEYKSEIYNRVLKELKALKSEKFLKSIEVYVNENCDNILGRFQEQFPKATKATVRWLALTIAGIQPKTIVFLMDMNLNTFYSQRSRLRKDIEASTAKDRDEFLKYLPASK